MKAGDKLAPWRRYAAPLVAVFIACGWLNQGLSLAHYDELHAALEVQPNASIVQRCGVFLSLLYRKSNDEELYYATGRAILGKPFDSAYLARARGDVPGAFAAPPPSDGRPHVPYVEVAFEYPPLALPFILAPALVTTGFEGYAHLFGALMGVCLLLGMSLAIASSSPEPRRKRECWWLASGLLLAQGGIAIQRLDAVLALFLALALWAAMRNKPGIFGLAMGLGIGIKFLPGFFLVPLLAADRRLLADRRTVQKTVGGLAFGLFVSFAPMLWWWPNAPNDVLRYHATRGLQVESTFGLALAVVRALSGHSSPATLSFGSFNLAGSDANLLSAISMPLLLAAMAFFAWYLYRAREEVAERQSDGLAVALLGGCVVVWLFSKVFSPQYLTWAMAIVLALSRRLGRKVTVLLLAAMATTQLYHRGFYDLLASGHPIGVLTAVVRQGLLVALAVVLMSWAIRRSKVDDSGPKSQPGVA